MDKVVLVAVVTPQLAATLAFVALGGSSYLALTIAGKNVENSSRTGAEAEGHS